MTDKEIEDETLALCKSQLTYVLEKKLKYKKVPQPENPKDFQRISFATPFTKFNWKLKESCNAEDYKEERKKLLMEIREAFSQVEQYLASVAENELPGIYGEFPREPGVYANAEVMFLTQNRPDGMPGKKLVNRLTVRITYVKKTKEENGSEKTS